MPRNTQDITHNCLFKVNSIDTFSSRRCHFFECFSLIDVRIKKQSLKGKFHL